MAALKQGDSVLKDLQKQATMEDWSELVENHAENQRIYDQEIEMFGAALQDDDLQNELDMLCADEVADQIADLGP